MEYTWSVIKAELHEIAQLDIVSNSQKNLYNLK